MSRRARWIGALLALGALLLLGWLTWYLTRADTGAASERRSPPSAVGVATAHRADVPVLLDALGTVKPVTSVTVQPQVSGVLAQVLYKEGQMVRQGELLALIEPEPFRIALEQARGVRLRDEAQLEAARLTLRRYRTLLAQDSIARQEVDTQAALVRQLEATVAIDRAAEETAALNLGYTRIAAPVQGRVGLRPVDAGNYVTTSGVQGIAVITQLDPIDVEFALPQGELPELQARVRAGATLPVAAWDQTRTRQLGEGVFMTTDNLIDTQTGTVKAKARFPNVAGTLYPNQFVNLRLRLRTIEGAVVVPLTALRHGPEGDYVYVVRDDRTVERRQVTRGAASGADVVIASGLAAGERVVTEGGDRLEEGARVLLPQDRADGVPEPGSGAAVAPASAPRAVPAAARR